MDSDQLEPAQKEWPQWRKGLKLAGKRPRKEQSGDIRVSPTCLFCVPQRVRTTPDDVTQWACLCPTPQKPPASFLSVSPGRQGAWPGCSLLSHYSRAVATAVVVPASAPPPLLAEFHSAACIISKAPSSRLLNFVQSTGLSPWAVISCPHQHQQGQ